MKPEKLFKIIAWILILAFAGSLIIFTPIFKPREIIVSGKNIGSKAIINLGLVSSSNIKNKSRVNLLFLGIAGQGYESPNLTDTVIIINSNPKGENPIVISIPRDLFVKFPDKNYYTKINSLYKWGETQEKGIELITAAIKKITDLEIDYFVVFDLSGVKEIIDKLNGIDIFVETDIYDPQFPGPDNSYITFSLSRGQHNLDGETALKYIRTRYGIEGDFGRIKRQQQIINALKDEILSLNPLWDLSTVLNIWNTLTKHTYSNIGLDDIRYTWKLAGNTDFNEMEFHTLDLIPDTITFSGKTAYILKPKAGIGSYEEIKEYINQLINQ